MFAVIVRRARPMQMASTTPVEMIPLVMRPSAVQISMWPIMFAVIVRRARQMQMAIMMLVEMIPLVMQPFAVQISVW
jgi:DNA-directed RNA polymerase subunit K/omega